ncbi:MAG: CCA tRNA nucleotidyltransferase [Oscillospiraceae bacterium]
MTCIAPPKYVIAVLTRLESRGFSAYLVGGCVRDIIMNRTPNDWDICTNALPDEVMEAFPYSRPTGIKHGTVTVREHGSDVEITTFRSDGEYSDHRRPKNVLFISDLKGDLERRDFTMNAIAVPLSGVIFDPFNGTDDIKRRTIRCVGDPNKRFNEDALRMLRAMRFSATLGFEIESETMAAIRQNAGLTATLAPERICIELEKILLSDAPSRISDLIEIGLLSRIIETKKAVPLDTLSRLPKNRLQRWAGLCALLLRSGIIDSTEVFLQTLRLDSATIHNSARGCELVVSSAPQSKLEWKRLLSRNGRDCGLCAAAAAEVLYGEGYLKALRSAASGNDCYSLKRLAITGDDLLELGFVGPELGKVLYMLLDHVLECPNDNKKFVLLAMAAKIPHNTGTDL